jgi:hypothetical protein
MQFDESFAAQQMEKEMITISAKLNHLVDSAFELIVTLDFMHEVADSLERIVDRFACDSRKYLVRVNCVRSIAMGKSFITD